MDAARNVDEKFDAHLMVRVSKRMARLYRQASRIDGYRKVAPWVRDKLEELAATTIAEKK